MLEAEALVYRFGSRGVEMALPVESTVVGMLSVSVASSPDPSLAHALASIAGDRSAMDRFVRVTAGVTSPAEMFAAQGAGAAV